MIIPLLLVPLIAWLVLRRRRPAGALPDKAVGYEEDAALDWRTARTLARFEGSRLLRHPAFLVGIVLTPLLLWAATSGATQHALWRDQLGIGLALAPLGWSAIVAANLATSRACRHGATELLRTAPTTPSSLTAGHIGAAWATVPVSVVLIALWMVVELWVFDATGSVDVLELVAPVLIVAGGVVVGVTVARYLPAAPFAFAAVFAVIMVQVAAEDNGIPDALGHGPGAARHLGFLVPPLSLGDPVLELRRPAWHAAYLLGATVLLAGVALARYGRTRVVAAVLGAGLLVTAGAGWTETRPPSSTQVASMVSRLSEPERHQRCETHGVARYCAYPNLDPAVDEWRAAVEQVTARVPASALDSRQLRVIQRAPTRLGNEDCAQAAFPSQLHREVADRIDPNVVWARDGDVHPPYAWPDQGPCGGRAFHGLFLGVQTGAWAVGLPPSPWADHQRCRADGEGRAVVALWLGAHAGPGAAEGLADLIRDPSAFDGDHLSFPRRQGHEPSWDSPPMWGVVWHRGDVSAALRLLEQPDGQVGRVLAERWAEVTAPGAPSSVLLEAAGMSSSGGATPVQPSDCG